jgi:hypothetical protein
VIFAKASRLNKLEAQTFIKAVSAEIASEWINQNCHDSRIGKTSGNRKLHHSCAVTFA